MCRNARHRAALPHSSARSATMLSHIIRHWFTQFGRFTAHPLAFLIVFIYGAAWLLLDRRSLDWQGVATMATWLMTLFVQRAEQRDTEAIQAKLDDLLRASGQPNWRLEDIDEEEPEEIEALRRRARER